METSSIERRAKREFVKHIHVKDEATLVALKQTEYFLGFFAIPLWNISGKFEGIWAEIWRTPKIKRDDLLTPSVLLFQALHATHSCQTPTSFPLHLKKLGHFNLSMVRSLPPLVFSACSLRLVLQSGWTWLVAGAPSPVPTWQSEPPCLGLVPFMEESSLLPLPAALSCQIPERTQVRLWFFPGKPAWSNPLPQPQERAGLRDRERESREDWAELTDSFDSEPCRCLAITPPFQDPISSSPLLCLLPVLSS